MQLGEPARVASFGRRRKFEEGLGHAPFLRTVCGVNRKIVSLVGSNRKPVATVKWVGEGCIVSMKPAATKYLVAD